MIEQKILEFRTHGRGTTDITAEVARAVTASGIKKGLCTVFLQHTSASPILCENAVPDVRRDLKPCYRASRQTAIRPTSTIRKGRTTWQRMRGRYLLRTA